MRATLQKIIHYAQKAPAGHNEQPWKFRAERCSLYIYPDYSRSRIGTDGSHRELFISLGCALENAVVAAKAFGYREMVTYRLSDDADYIRITLEPSESTNGQDLFLAIGDQPNTHSAYKKQAIPAEQLAELALQARERDVFLKIFDTDEELDRLLPLVEEAAVLQYRDKDFPDWLRNNDSDRKRHKDGLWSNGPGSPVFPEWMGRLYRNRIVSAKAEAKKARELVLGSAALVLFSTVNNTKEGWVNLGRSYQRMALKATALGIRHSPLNLPCEEAVVREKLKKWLEYTHEEPVLLIRLGYEKAAGVPGDGKRVTESVSH